MNDIETSPLYDNEHNVHAYIAKSVVTGISAIGTTREEAKKNLGRALDRITEETEHKGLLTLTLTNMSSKPYVHVWFLHDCPELWDFLNQHATTGCFTSVKS